VLVGTSRIADCIARPEETEAIHDAVAEGGYYGMQTFDQALLQLVIDGAVTVEEAMYYATSKQNFALLLEAHSVSIDRDLRRRASGSMVSVQDEVSYDDARHGRPVAPPPPGAPQAVTPASLGITLPGAASPARSPQMPNLPGQPGHGGRGAA
jgi:twitching motility protein PilT